MFRLRVAPSTLARSNNTLLKPHTLPRPFITGLPVATARRFDSTTTQPKISDRIKHDHKELEDCYNAIITSKDPAQQVRFQNLFVWELARHSIAEEIVVYPAFEKYIPDGKLMADKDRAEHLEVKELLYDFQNMTPEDPAFITTLQSLWSSLSKHIKEEERQDLPALEKHIDSDVSMSMANSFQKTKHFVPTRSHPSAPDKPPYETAVGLLTTPMDKLMDMFKTFPKDEERPNPPGARPPA
ncbi:hypothetical protein QBC37DRAFT_431773 [Rhypophila decipiens]|uniref:Hemerythrin-like domain-containing protein n=1 Tax=Rhypophila decipiens TaxID=261697 RepID=A0AAN6XXQ3_9PEZI|nr:hypothetical protein QBC37DRAFT_431773 [Rhypophila decipiens]